MTLDVFLRDVRFAFRTMRKNPGFTSVVVITLALGIGANTVMFSVLNAVLLRALPYKDPANLVLLSTDSRDSTAGTSYTAYEACGSHAHAFAELAVYYRNSGWSRVTLTGTNEPESVQGAFVSASFFPVMGVSPQMGRVFSVEEATRRDRVVILSDALWQRRFGSAPDVLGKLIEVDGMGFQVIGVMPASFQFPARETQFWAPITTNRYWLDNLPAWDSSHSAGFYLRWNIVGRLKSGATLRSAQVEANVLAAHLNLNPNGGRGISVIPLTVEMSGNTRLALFVLWAAVSFVLVIACSNVAHLTLTRAAARDREMAIRTALGAGRGRLLQQSLTESTMLALSGGILGLVMAAGGIHAVIAFGPRDIPRLEQTGIDAGVLAFTLGASLLAAMLFGLGTAWKTARSDPNESLKSGSRTATGTRHGTRTRRFLVAFEVGLTVLLLTGAGLLLRSYLAIRGVDPGFKPERLITMRVLLPDATAESRRVTFYEQLLERVRALPGVQAVGGIAGLFEPGAPMLGLRSIEGREPEPPSRWTTLKWTTISGDYLQAMGAPLLRGRFFSERDGPGSGLVAIVDESLARRYWPGEDPIGRRFKGQDRRGTNDEWLTVIGVVGDMRRNGLERQPVPHVFEWRRQSHATTPDFVVRTATSPGQLILARRNTIRGLDRTAVISRLAPMQKQLDEQLAPRRFQTWLLGLFSAIALVLASVGIYGVIHYSVAQRVHEIGIRMALGAQAGTVLRMVMRQGLTPALCGLGGGLLSAAWLTGLLSSMLYGVTPVDPATFAAVSALLIVVAAAATSIPAWRASRLDPLTALRDE